MTKKYIIISLIFILLLSACSNNNIVKRKDNFYNSKKSFQKSNLEDINNSPIKNVVNNTKNDIKSNTDISPNKDLNNKIQSKNKAVPEKSDFTEVINDVYKTQSNVIHKNVKNKVVYITIDDGPSIITPKFLEILDKYKIKATFFVVGINCLRYKDYLKEIASSGHSIGNHSYSHKYNIIYKNASQFYNEFYKTQNIIYTITGIWPKIMRFPGGSSNKITPEIEKALIRLNLQYYDWNSITGDANPKTIKVMTSDDVVKNVFSNFKYQDKIVILMHDSPNKIFSLNALPKIIERFKALGYSFDKLTEDVSPIHFSNGIVKNNDNRDETIQTFSEVNKEVYKSIYNDVVKDVYSSVYQEIYR
ncbi:polysaccharide deacetylase family protein [Caldicellulosiruptoraceae bacterium PP1]